MSNKIWTSRKIYEHPLLPDTHGLVCHGSTGIYTMRVGGSRISCPQDWASKIHTEELGGQTETTAGRPQIGTAQLTALIVPEELRGALEEAAEARGLSLPDARREAYKMWINSK
jgi:hypothetical protein